MATTPRLQAKDELMAQFLVLLIGKLTGWNAPIGGGGDPVYLTGEQTQSLAAEGISLLTTFLPAEAAQKVAAAIERVPRHPHATHEQKLLRVGSLGGVIPSVHGGVGGEAPGCCVEINGHLVCVR